ncbi:hypothetical protein [Roseinatronobacter sp.]
MQVISTPRDLRPYLRRLYNPLTGQYLHLSGRGETSGTAHAWAGTREQAQTLRARARAAKEPFPFRLAPLIEERAET